jgi:hypothetical protein
MMRQPLLNVYIKMTYKCVRQRNRGTGLTKKTLLEAIKTGFRQSLKKMDIRSARGDHLSRRSVFETHPNGLALFSQVHSVEPLNHLRYQTLIGTR